MNEAHTNRGFCNAQKQHFSNMHFFEHGFLHPTLQNSMKNIALGRKNSSQMLFMKPFQFQHD
jgi:hypothetical protein